MKKFTKSSMRRPKKMRDSLSVTLGAAKKENEF